jgi:phosphoribosylanthranilate isomerase
MVERVGVFTHHDASAIAAVVEHCGLTAVQLQSRHTQNQGRALHVLAPNAKVIAAFPWAGPEDFSQRLAANARQHVFDALLVDSPTAHDRGGTGQMFAWEEAAGCFADASKLRLPAIAAGGMNAHNVTAAITVLHPWGVDAVSSVEAVPGVKDPVLVHAFMNAVHAATAAFAP